MITEYEYDPYCSLGSFVAINMSIFRYIYLNSSLSYSLGAYVYEQSCAWEIYYPSE